MFGFRLIVEEGLSHAVLTQMHRFVLQGWPTGLNRQAGSSRVKTFLHNNVRFHSFQMLGVLLNIVQDFP